MCYYNGQKVTRSEFIRLKNLEKTIAKIFIFEQGGSSYWIQLW